MRIRLMALIKATPSRWLQTMREQARGISLISFGFLEKITRRSRINKLHKNWKQIDKNNEIEMRNIEILQACRISLIMNGPNER